MKKALFVLSLIVASLLVSLFHFTNQPASAACVNGIDEDTGQPCTSNSPPPQNNTSASAKEKCEEASDTSFLNFPRWHRGLDCDANGSIDIDGGEVGPIVFTIALNVLDIMLRLAGVLAVGFVVFGGFQYMTARGEPENAKKGRDTVIKALIGMGIAMVSAFVVAFVVARLGPLPSTIIQKRHSGIILFSQLVFQ
jgi:hypothetical protein